jgi:hypothetical protein
MSRRSNSRKYNGDSLALSRRLLRRHFRLELMEERAQKKRGEKISPRSINSQVV